MVPGSQGNLIRGSSARVIIVKILLHTDVSRFQPQRDENPTSRLADEGWWHPCVEPSDCSWYGWHHAFCCRKQSCIGKTGIYILHYMEIGWLRTNTSNTMAVADLSKLTLSLSLFVSVYIYNACAQGRACTRVCSVGVCMWMCVLVKKKF